MRAKLTFIATCAALAFTVAILISSSGGEASTSGAPDLNLSQGDPAPVVSEPGELVRVVGPDGKEIVCDDGKALLIDPVSDNPPKDIISTQATEDPTVLETTEGAVPRCGPSGGGSDSNPVWVPESVGEDHPVNPPAEYVETQSGP